jgi:hypothetical protein
VHPQVRYRWSKAGQSTSRIALDVSGPEVRNTPSGLWGKCPSHIQSAEGHNQSFELLVDLFQIRRWGMSEVCAVDAENTEPVIEHVTNIIIII